MSIRDENGILIEIPEELYPQILKMIRKYKVKRVHKDNSKSIQDREEIQYHCVKQKDIDEFFHITK